MWFQVNSYLPMRAMYILINRGKQGATMSRKKVSILCSHRHLAILFHYILNIVVLFWHNTELM